MKKLGNRLRFSHASRRIKNHHKGRKKERKKEKKQWRAREENECMILPRGAPLSLVLSADEEGGIDAIDDEIQLQ